ncbi:MAG TPA: hypothetical protein VGN97_06070 [Mesorhizobium sp.]|nr:hypothetical protein [Mesorhizobium sp.]
MSDDPETLRQIEALSHDARPLLVVDVDEVVLEFVNPFNAFLNGRGLELGQTSFRLHGNIFSRADRAALVDEAVSALIEEFWGVQADWQQLAAGAPDVLEGLSAQVSVVLLTAMPHRFREHRRKHLEALGLAHPLLTTEAAKGPAVARLRGPSRRPVGFVDDIPRNLRSVRDAVPDAALFHLMAHPGFRALLPPLEDGITSVEDWPSAEAPIRRALGLSA